MSYEDCEAAMVTLLKGLTGMVDRVVIGDFKLANKGPTKFIVVKYGGFRQTRDAFGDHEVVWNIELHLGVRYKDDSQVRDDQRDLRNEVLAKLNANPSLNSTVGVLDMLARYGRVGDEVASLGNIRVFYEVLECEVTEYFTVSEA